MLDSYGADPSSEFPYIMWKGTPYAHVMVPVTAGREFRYRAYARLFTGASNHTP